MTREHLGLCFSLGIPVFCVVTGADLVAPLPGHGFASTLELLTLCVVLCDLVRTQRFNAILHVF